MILCVSFANSLQLSNFGAIGDLCLDQVKFWTVKVSFPWRYNSLLYLRTLLVWFCFHCTRVLEFSHCWSRKIVTQFCLLIESVVEGRSIEAFSVFKKGIRPEWEDVSNRLGSDLTCRWVYSLPRRISFLQTYWKFLPITEVVWVPWTRLIILVRFS